MAENNIGIVFNDEAHHTIHCYSIVVNNVARSEGLGEFCDGNLKIIIDELNGDDLIHELVVCSLV